MKIYTNIDHYNQEYRTELADILKPFINKRTLQENVNIYGHHITDNRIVDTLTNADLCVLPMSWNYYLQTKQLHLAYSFINQAKSVEKIVVVWISGDFGIKIPIDGIWEFRLSGYRSNRKQNQYALPVIIQDPIKDLDTNEIKVRSKKSYPTIGFCGQADDDIFGKLMKRTKTLFQNLKYYSGISTYEPLPKFLPTTLRKKTLSILEQDKKIRTRFIKHSKYKAGAKTSIEIKKARQVFFNNIQDSDYTICIRGTGNFSARLYETLAMGRIPIFIDTDCILPYDFDIDWKNYSIWVDYHNLKSLPQRILEFHHNISNEEFFELQYECRKLWESKLSYSGFYSNFHQHFHPD